MAKKDAVLDPESFAYFATKNFCGGAPPHFSRKELRHPLLPYTPEKDRGAALKLWRTILRFMGDVADYRGAIQNSYQPDFGSVMSRLYGELGIQQSERDVRRRSSFTQNSPPSQPEASPPPEEEISQKIRGKSGTIRRLKHTLSKKFNKPKKKTVFDFLPLEETLRTPLDQLHFIIGFGILKPSLRDEIYCQICKQLSNNPYKSSQARGWLLLSLCCGCFVPSNTLVKYITKFLENGPPYYASTCKKLTQRTTENGIRYQPPSFLELESGLAKKLLELPVTFMDGTMQTLVVDAATTSRELCRKLCDQIGLKENFGFSLFITMYDKVASLGNGGDHVLDSVSQCEQINRDQDGKEGHAPWRLFFRKEIFSPWENGLTDPVACNLIFAQIIRGIMLGEYVCDKDQDLAVLAAQQYFIDYGKDISGDGLTALLPSYIPPDRREDTDSLKEWRKMVMKAHHKLFSTKEARNWSGDKVKADIVKFSKIKWSMSFSRYYDVTKLEGPDWPSDLTLAINWTGLYLLHEGRTIHEVSYPEIYSLHGGQKEDSRRESSPVIHLMMVDGSSLKMSSPDVDDIRSILMFMMEGLKKRSRYVVAVQDHNISHDPSKLRFVQGDPIFLTQCTGARVMQSEWATGENLRSKLKGEFATENIYVLPSLVRPSNDVLEMFRKNKTVTHRLTSSNGDSDSYFNVGSDINSSFTDEEPRITDEESTLASLSSSSAGKEITPL